jgi:hypothetical protein
MAEVTCGHDEQRSGRTNRCIHGEQKFNFVAIMKRKYCCLLLLSLAWYLALEMEKVTQVIAKHLTNEEL